ncbi:hypothetical protein EG329_004147 [Mollisiaceae sp. DMI_Dod_QoI]|nr:hypothetical protein EG329_004147 [Helotiales sp. DMI_Dod_QoI]
MPHPSVAAAEKAAIAGDVPEIDTQGCFVLQQELLSSSPALPEHVVASTIDAVIHEPKFNVEVEQDEGQVEQIEVNHDAVEHCGTTGVRQLIHDLISQPDQDRAPVEPSHQGRATPLQFRRDSKGKLRPLKGNEFRRPGFDEQYRAAVEEAHRTEMEDLTQKSTMSLTQENTQSAYEQFDIQQVICDDCPSTGTPGDGEDQNTAPNTHHDSIHSMHSKHHASTRTESTAYTYQENDTGHVKLDFVPDIVGDEMDEMDEDQSQSQDASFADPQLGLHFSAPSYDPQTPAAPVNPFSQKGSVMKGFELFGATQPSSIARHVASPTSSRPSPDVYNDFTSPPKRQRLGSSPLARLHESKEGAHISPLQSSVRNLLTASMSTDFPDATIPRTSGVQSFDGGPRLSRTESMREFRPYVSMKESQERRRRDSMHSRSDSYSSDSDVEEARNRKRDRELRIQMELSTVALPPRRMPPSSRPSSSIEVPSTGRRLRVFQDDYLAQCEGLDARDTQDDVIADSQGHPDQDAAVGQVHESVDRSEDPVNVEQSELDPTASNTPFQLHQNNGDLNPPFQEEPLPEEGAATRGLMDLNEPSQLDVTAAANTTGSSLPEPSLPSLPLQELSSNRNDLRTPIAPKLHLLSDGLDTVPETSPPAGRIRPMSDIATISFRETQVDMNDLPGFTPDIDFEKAMDIASSPRPAPRPRSFRNNPPSQGAVLVAPIGSEQLPEETPSSSDVPSTLPGQGQPSIVTATLPTSPISGDAPSTENAAVLQGPMRPTRNDATLPEKATSPQERTDIDSQPLIPELLQDELEENKTVDREGRSEGGEDEDVLSDKHDKVSEGPSLAVENSGLTGVDINNSPRPSSTARTGLRAKSELKGPSRALRRSGTKSSNTTPQQLSRVAKSKAASKSSASSTPSITSPSVPDPGPSERSTTRSKASLGKSEKQPTLALPPTAKRSTKRQSGVTVVDDGDQPIVPTRASKRQSTAHFSRDESEDPLATLTPPSAYKAARSKRSVSVLFDRMAFAVSYVKNDQERDSVTKLIVDNGGRILQDGFDALFGVISKTASEDVELSLSESANSLGFTALIADEHSRKAKFMQALALGLPCISGRWVSACVSKMAIIDWTPYLLCAGQSSFLGNAFRSRTIRPYPAADAVLADIFSGRDKLLEGKSVLLVTGKGKTEDKRKAYVFLTRALGPARVGQVVDFQEARKRLVEAEAQDQGYDLLYVEGNEKAADSSVFGSASVTSSGTKKRKRGPVESADVEIPTPKKIRIIVDETMVQSLILGQLLEE